MLPRQGMRPAETANGKTGMAAWMVWWTQMTFLSRSRRRRCCCCCRCRVVTRKPQRKRESRSASNQGIRDDNKWAVPLSGTSITKLVVITQSRVPLGWTNWERQNILRSDTTVCKSLVVFFAPNAFVDFRIAMLRFVFHFFQTLPRPYFDFVER